MSRKTRSRRGAAPRTAPQAATAARPQAALRPEPPLAAAGISLALMALVWAVFGQTVGFKFLNYDDNRYILENPHVRSGISLANIRWVCTHMDIHLWSPVTSISHMLDCQLFHLAAGGHHFTNVLLHTATAVLLFLVLWQMTGAIWRCAFIAACFAIHPLRVESVAWIAERKDMLNGLFFTLTLGAYVRYARGKPSMARFFPVALFLALGLMAKPMLATLPLLLLLLDYWPLARIREMPAPRPAGAGPARIESLRQLIGEKIPLLVISAAVISVTLFSSGGGKIGQPPDAPPPLLIRLGNGLAAALIYIRQMFWPSDTGLIQSTLHPILAAPMLALGLVGLAAVSGAALFYAKRRPYLPVGWFWYLGMLVPVSGVTALGYESRADRYTYLPQIGLYVLLTWLVADATLRLPRRQVILGAIMAAILTVLGWLAHRQAAYWRDTKTLWTETLARTTGNVIAEENLGATLIAEGHYDAGVAHYRQAVLLWPTSAALIESLGAALYQEGRIDDAADAFTRAIQLAPRSFTAHDNMGLALLKKGHPDDAAAEYRKALELNPGDPHAHQYLAHLDASSGRPGEAIAEYRKEIEIIPDDPEPRDALALLLIRQRQIPDAIAELNAALELNPNDINAANNLAMILATSPVSSIRDGPRAVRLAERAARLTGGDPLVLSALGAAYAECGRFSDAIAILERALDSRGIQSNPQLAGMLRTHLATYRSNTPLRDASLAPPETPAQPEGPVPLENPVH